MNAFFRLSLVVLMLSTVSIKAQNLVPNGSFEEYIDCPTALDMLGTHCEGWFSSRGTCDYYNGCKSTWGVSVPSSVFGYQEALTGDAYAGLISYDSSSPNWREHMSIELFEPLQIGIKYFLSFYVSLAYNNGHSNKASNGQGAYFTTIEHSSIWDINPEDNPSPLIIESVILNDNILSDTTNWVQLKGSFIADSSYTHLVIGGMFTDDQVDTLDLGINDLTGQAYYYIDEIRVSTDSLFGHEDITSTGAEKVTPELTIYPNPTNNVIYFGNSTPISVVEVYSWNLDLIQIQKSNINMGLDMSGLEQGCYHLRILFEDGRSYFKKVIKY